MRSGYRRFIVDSDSESAALGFALRKWTDGAICTNDGSIADMELGGRMLTAGIKVPSEDGRKKQSELGKEVDFSKERVVLGNFIQHSD